MRARGEVLDRRKQFGDAGHRRALELRIAGRRQVDQDVRGSTASSRLAETAQRRRRRSRRWDCCVRRAPRRRRRGRDTPRGSAAGPPTRARAAVCIASARASISASFSRGILSAAAKPAYASASSSAIARKRSDSRRPVSRRQRQHRFVVDVLRAARGQRGDHRDEARAEGRRDRRRATATGDRIRRRESRRELVDREVAEPAFIASGMHRAIVGCRPQRSPNVSWEPASTIASRGRGAGKAETSRRRARWVREGARAGDNAANDHDREARRVGRGGTGASALGARRVANGCGRASSAGLM